MKINSLIAKACSSIIKNALVEPSLDLDTKKKVAERLTALFKKAREEPETPLIELDTRSIKENPDPLRLLIKHIVDALSVDFPMTSSTKMALRHYSLDELDEAPLKRIRFPNKITIHPIPKRSPLSFGSILKISDFHEFVNAFETALIKICTSSLDKKPRPPASELLEKAFYATLEKAPSTAKHFRSVFIGRVKAFNESVKNISGEEFSDLLSHQNTFKRAYSFNPQDRRIKKAISEITKGEWDPERYRKIPLSLLKKKKIEKLISIITILFERDDLKKCLDRIIKENERK